MLGYQNKFLVEFSNFFFFLFKIVFLYIRDILPGLSCINFSLFNTFLSNSQNHLS